MTAGDAAKRWLVPPPEPAGRILFCLPYAGVGASSYRQWPRRFGDVQVCALQPPGRENRMRESPHRGLYGRLNFVDLDTVDLVAETASLFGTAGAPVRADFAELAARVLRTDLEVQRGYRFEPGRKVPCPVTVVAWTRDDVVPPDVAFPGWEECADATRVLLDGAHLDFLRCVDVLRDAMYRWLGEAPAADRDQHRNESRAEVRMGGDRRD